MDLGIVNDSDKSMVMDRSKIRRAKARVGKEDDEKRGIEVTKLTCIGFDSRNDSKVCFLLMWIRNYFVSDPAMTLENVLSSFGSDYIYSTAISYLSTDRRIPVTAHVLHTLYPVFVYSRIQVIAPRVRLFYLADLTSQSPSILQAFPPAHPVR